MARLRMGLGLLVLTLALAWGLLSCAEVGGEKPRSTTLLTAERSAPSDVHGPAAAAIPGSPNAASGATYYVGQTGCSDTGPGDNQTPFCSFDTALGRLQAGDTLIIKAGTYAERLLVNNLSGTANAPIVIRGESRAGVILDGGCPDFPCSINDVDRNEWGELLSEWATVEGMVNIQDSTFITLRDLTVQNVIAAGVNVLRGSSIVVDNIVTDGTGNNGLLLEQTSNLTVTNNDVGRAQLGFRDDQGNARGGIHEALSVVAVSEFLVAHNYVHDTLKEGINVKESSTNGEVHHNFVERACAVGIYIDEAHNVLLYRNEIRRSGYLTDGGQEKLCSTHPVFGPEFGQFYGAGILLAVGDLGQKSQGQLSNIRVYQNVVWDPHGDGLQFWDELRQSGTGQGQMTGNRVYNNVFYNARLAGIRLDDAIDTTVFNNIIALNDEEGIVGNAIANSAISHNLFQFRHDWHEPVGTDNVIGDPLFVDPSNDDFHLQGGSPAIDNGLEMGLPYAGTAPDIGAYEFGALPATPTPTPTPTPTATPAPDGLLGDTDCDQDVDSVDALWVLKDTAVLPHSAACIAEGDVDCDGDRDSVDALFILRHVAALPVNLPPGCGPIGP